MDPLSALAIAAAVFQFLELGGNLCVKGWNKYHGIQRNAPKDKKKLAEEEEELRNIFEELSDQISRFRQVSTDIVVSQPPTPTQVQLLKLSSQCADLSCDFERMQSRLKLPTGNSRAMVSAKTKNAETRKKHDEMEHIREQLELLKRETMDFIFLSLWDDSKRTKQWELHFSSQLDKLIELLGSAEKLSMNNLQEPIVANREALVQEHTLENMQASSTAISPMEDEETARLRNALQPLIQPETEPVSLKKLADDMIEYLPMDGKAMKAIREELINILWKKDWNLDSSMTSAKIDTTVVGHAIAAGIYFHTIQIREDSIAKSFKNTYSWILQDEPLNRDDMPTLSSFPKWLDDDSEKVYWITGKPGSGKSTIMKMILNHDNLIVRLSRSLGTLRLLLIKYYAWSAGDTLQKSIEGLKRTIIFQALKQHPDLAPMLTPRRWVFCQVLRHTSGLPNWNTWEIEESFEALLSSCGEIIKLALFLDGLDEFVTPPFEIIRCIRHMMARCPKGLKICAASRPWPQFLDEFNEGPMLQMHLLTENDMEIFVNKNLTVNKGFVEQMQLKPRAASQLLMDIVQRANGVFLWVSIVVQLLSTGFSEGESISQARQTLKCLPSDISSLYDAIWAGICPNNLPDTSYLIQVQRAFEGPLPWLILWLIEESRFTTTDKIFLPESDNEITAAHSSLKRKLAARTRCILEVNEGSESYVDFIHRTAKDWAVQPDIWQQICSKIDGRFDPSLYILKGEALHLWRSPQIHTIRDLNSILRILRFASQVRDIPENESAAVSYLHLADERFKSIANQYQDPWMVCGSEAEANLAMQTFTKDYGKNFLELAAHFAILPYIKDLASSNPTRLSREFYGHSLNFIKKAIYVDFKNNTAPFGPKTHYDRRLATVKYLLEQDVIEWRARTWKKPIRNLKNDIQEDLIRYPESSEYLSKVILYLDEKQRNLSPEPSITSRIWVYFKKWMK